MKNKTITLLTNRENAQHSTGPRTPAGKRTSSRNALRHGLTGNFVLLPSEDPEAYQRFSDDLTHDLQPEGALEIQLAQTCADTQWRIRRIHSLEAALFEQSGDETTPDFATGLDRQLLRLQLLSLYEQRLTRIFHATLKQLQQLQSARRERIKTETCPAGRVRKLVTSQGFAFHPPEFGFVSSPAQLERAIRLHEATHGAFNSALGVYTNENQPSSFV